MEKRKIILFDILLGLFFFYTTYYFIQYEFFEYSRSLGETVMKRSFKNPLNVIFIGGQYGEGGSYRIFDIMTRFMTFFEMFISVILILGIFQYYKSKRKKVLIFIKGTGFI